MKSCCNHTKNVKKCKRTKDNKIFVLPRKFTKKKCLDSNKKGFSMKSSCAPYKYCKKSHFLYHPDNPKKSFDVYVDKNPKDTITIKYTTVEDVKNTIKKLENLYKTNKYNHKRIWQVGMIMKVRLEAMLKHKSKLYPNAKFVKERYQLANKYFIFLRKRTKTSDLKRKLLVFKFN